jgi:hypothetical protein
VIGEHMSSTKVIRIGNASGYWGDDPDALYRQVTGGRLDYITMDFLAEITMSIMQKQKGRDPSSGYARDFIPMLEKVLPELLSGGTKLITNAGGIHPEACAAAVRTMAKQMGLNPRIAVVYGDDILGSLDDLMAQGAAFTNMDDGRAFADVRQKIQAANVYFGAAPVVKALAWNPDIIITGRVTDTGITLAPMIHEFGWSFSDFDKLASGIVAGHILECGSQATGGNFTDWTKVPSYDKIGYPIVEVLANGDFVVTKHQGSGGLVSVDTVREQLFYEMGDPKAYLTPDVVADFSTIQLEPAGPDRVKVTKVKGYEPTSLYKVSMAYEDGFKCIGEIAISGPDARYKAETFAAILWERAGEDFAARETEYFGFNACHKGLGHQQEGNEIILRLGARDQSDKKLKKFSKLIPSLILGGPAGVAVLGGAPRTQAIVSYWPALIPKTLLTPMIGLYGEDRLVEKAEVKTTLSGQFKPGTNQGVEIVKTATQSLTQALGDTSTGTPLLEIALARSGDKGDTANIGVLARSPKAYAFLDTWLTAERMKNLFQEFCHGAVTRFPVKNMLGFNFLLENALGGGGTMTLRADAQGKTFAQAILRQKALIPAEILAEVAALGNTPKKPGVKP